MPDDNLVKQISDLIDEKLDKFAKGQLVEILDERLDPIKLSLIEIESTMKSYSDRYKINDDNIRKIEKRVEVAEDKLKITPSEEHQLIPPSEFS